jgi:hypothetical protein
MPQGQGIGSYQKRFAGVTTVYPRMKAFLVEGSYTGSLMVTKS